MAAGLPLLTPPAATTGLFAVADGWARGGSPPVFREVFRHRPGRNLTVGGALTTCAVAAVVDVSFALGADGAPPSASPPRRWVSPASSLPAAGP
ncbi:hypothetical protein [Streptomyces sp. NPDC127098]|uniref:hypothetical protein n=1 Tax=Streptomyces sp. NPDC127098 TaxID=3347137 RepID=UPI0036585D77